MSQSEDLIRRSTDALNRRDLDAFIADLHPDVEIVPLRAAVEDTVYRGLDGARQFWSDTEEVWSEMRIEVERWTDLDGGRLLILGSVFLRGKSSEAPVEQEIGWLSTIENGKVRRIAIYPTRAEARSAAGLAETP